MTRPETACRRSGLGWRRCQSGICLLRSRPANYGLAEALGMGVRAATVATLRIWWVPFAEPPRSRREEPCASMPALFHKLRRLPCRCCASRLAALSCSSCAMSLGIGRFVGMASAGRMQSLRQVPDLTARKYHQGSGGLLNSRQTLKRLRKQTLIQRNVL